MAEQTLKEQFLTLISNQKAICKPCYLWDNDGCYCNGDTHIEICELFDKLSSLILSEIDKAGLTPEQIDKLDYLKNTPEFMTSRQVDVWIKKVVATAQLEAIKKQLRGEGK